jgi:hypothetical protein
VVGLVYLLGRYPVLLIKREGNSIRNVVAGIALCLALCLPLVPLYLGLLPGISSSEQLKAVAHPSIIAALQSVIIVTVELPTLWELGLIIALLSPLTLLVRSNRFALFSLSVLIASLLPLTLVAENRLAYVVPLGVTAGLAAWWFAAEPMRVWRPRAFDAAMVAFLALDILTGTQSFDVQRNLYTVLNPAVVRGLAQLQTVSRPDQVIVVSAGPHDWEFGWWVEGADHRRAIYAGNPIWLFYADERARNAVANDIFDQGKTPSGSARLAREHGAAYIFVDKDWPGYSSWIGGRQDLDPSVLVYENQSVMIIDTGLGGP